MLLLENMVYRPENHVGGTERSAALEEKRAHLINALEERLRDFGLLESEENLDPTHIFAPKIEVTPTIEAYSCKLRLPLFPLLLVCPPSQTNKEARLVFTDNPEDLCLTEFLLETAEVLPGYKNLGPIPLPFPEIERDSDLVFINGKNYRGPDCFKVDPYRLPLGPLPNERQWPGREEGILLLMVDPTKRGEPGEEGVICVSSISGPKGWRGLFLKERLLRVQPSRVIEEVSPPPVPEPSPLGVEDLARLIETEPLKAFQRIEERIKEGKDDKKRRNRPFLIYTGAVRLEKGTRMATLAEKDTPVRVLILPDERTIRFTFLSLNPDTIAEHYRQSPIFTSSIITESFSRATPKNKEVRLVLEVKLREEKLQIKPQVIKWDGIKFVRVENLSFLARKCVGTPKGFAQLFSLLEHQPRKSRSTKSWALQ
jgi:hypothetical protein